MVQSSEFAKKIGAMQALKILHFMLLLILLLHILFMVFMASKAKIFRLVISFSVSKSDPRYLHAVHHLSSPFFYFIIFIFLFVAVQISSFRGLGYGGSSIFQVSGRRSLFEDLCGLHMNDLGGESWL